MEYDVAPWITLKSIKGLGNILIKRLIEKFGTPEKIFCANSKELCLVEGITSEKAGKIKKTKEPGFAKDEIKLAVKEGIEILPFCHHNYPGLLREIPDPPPILYVRGVLPPDIVSFAIVGSRKASPQGRAGASKISSYLSSAGIRITSGMALGIDGAAHSAALGKPGGTTAVLGSGLLNIYPREHKALYKRIVDSGAVVSEFMLNEKPRAFNFPARNRIISGLSIGVLVVEAMERSGALITANLAADQGKDVFTLKLFNVNSPGTEKLNSSGTTEITGPQEILKEYPWLDSEINLKKNHKKSLDLNEKVMIKALKQSKDPLHIEELIKLCPDTEAGEMAALILNLELKGIINQLPGKFYYLIEDEN